MDLTVRHEYVLELLDYEAKSLVGKICKRFEIINTIVKDKDGNLLEDESEARKDLLKTNVKELVYEEMRHIRDLLIAGGRGLEQKVFKFGRETR